MRNRGNHYFLNADTALNRERVAYFYDQRRLQAVARNRADSGAPYVACVNCVGRQIIFRPQVEEFGLSEIGMKRTLWGAVSAAVPVVTVQPRPAPTRVKVVLT